MATKFISSSGGGYLPPYMRNRIASSAADPKIPEALRIDDMKQFPGLKSAAPPKKATCWTGMVSFKDTIVNLIEQEKKTEEERRAEREKDREKDAWAHLSLKFDKERYIEFNEKMLGIHHRTLQVNNLIQQGIYAEANLESEVVYNDSDIECFSVSTDSYLEEQARLEEEDKEEGGDDEDRYSN
jgi:hypothetical protein